VYFVASISTAATVASATIAVTTSADAAAAVAATTVTLPAATLAVAAPNFAFTVISPSAAGHKSDGTAAAAVSSNT